MLRIKANWFDNLIGFFSPRAKANRLKYKAASSLIERKYEGGAGGRRVNDWYTPGTSANAEIEQFRGHLVNRSRDLHRNNPYAARGNEVIVANAIGGRGITAEIKEPERPRTGRPRRTQAEQESTLKQMWRTWAGTAAMDWDGRHNLPAMQRLVMRSVVESGEVLIRLRRTSRRRAMGADGVIREVPPIKLQVLESDFINSAITSQKRGSNSITQGIEFNESGERIAYHLFQRHPGANDLFPDTTFNTIRVPADEILHIYRADRPGQIRGVPWLAPVILRLRDLDKYEDFQLVRQQVAACFAGFIHDNEGGDLAQTEEEKELAAKLEPGLLEVLPPGKDIRFADPPEATNYKEYINTLLHAISAGLGVPFESLTGDLSQVNFSSARMGWLEFQRNLDVWRWQIMVPQFLEPSFSWFLNSAAILGQQTDRVDAVWTAPRREMIDPTKEVPALKDAIRSGLMTQSESIRQQGHDPERFFKEYKADTERLDDLELILDSDPRKDVRRSDLGANQNG